MKKLHAAIFAVGVLVSGIASAALVTFDTAAGLPNNYTDQGVTFNNLGTSTSTFTTTTPNGSRAILLRDIFGGVNSAMRATIAGGASSVSIDLGDFNADADRIFLSAFDSLNNLLGTTTFDLPASFIGMHTLSLDVANIAYATFGLTGGIGRGAIYADNFVYSNQAVPEPTAIALLLLALCAMALVSRRQTIR